MFINCLRLARTSSSSIIFAASKAHIKPIALARPFALGTPTSTFVSSCQQAIPFSMSYEKAGIVPDVISEAPARTVRVEYAGGVSVDSGNQLTPTQVKDQPIAVEWPTTGHAPDTLYTLVMTDPDAPSRQQPTYREWHHWLVANIPGNSIAAGGDVLSAYIGSGPPPNTGLHRYVFLVYRQTERLVFEDKRLPNNSADGRGGFKVAAFAEKYKLGQPIAGNFYEAEYDDYVPTLYKQLGA